MNTYWGPIVEALLVGFGLVFFLFSVFLGLRLRPRYVKRAQEQYRATSSLYFGLVIMLIIVAWIVATAVNLSAALALFPLLGPAAFAAAIDAQTHYLPNQLVGLCWLAVAFSFCLSSLVLPVAQIGFAIAVGFFAGALFWLFSYLELGISAGDVKLIPPLIGTAFHNGLLLPYIMILALLPGLYALGVYVMTKDRHQRIAYGPWMVIALPLATFFPL
ncbi:hypothetical protein [Boudabousia marimammalium]|uniref:Prepilin type IV endopeptidase peptidase domain-containing protein n=1 Tax=Boudabousia marimammalium TaxID=156892 RepID=A0A1Q5PR99_9ACTO|nr:hypothetical protein [Boudabousia marimammalium]OKL50009.1 hypothetical protein BM477_03710 [Boudabousia marimammalium]